MTPTAGSSADEFISIESAGVAQLCLAPITELLTWTVGQVRDPAGEVLREVTVTRELLKGGSGLRYYSPSLGRFINRE